MADPAEPPAPEGSPRLAEISADGGLIVLRDDASPLSIEGVDPHRLRSHLRERTVEGGLFLVDGEDPVTCRLELWIDQAIPPNRVEDFPAASGAFRLELPTGELVLAGLDEHGSKTALDRHRVEAGTHRLTARWSPEFDPARHDRRMVELLGEDDWRWLRTVDRVGAAGCLALLPAVALLAIPALRPLAPVGVPLLLVPQLLHLALRRWPRTRRIEGRRVGDEARWPHLLLELRRIEDGEHEPARGLDRGAAPMSWGPESRGMIAGTGTTPSASWPGCS